MAIITLLLGLGMTVLLGGTILARVVSVQRARAVAVRTARHLPRGHTTGRP